MCLKTDKVTQQIHLRLSCSWGTILSSAMMAPTKQLVTISASNDILVITFRFESQIEELTEPLRSLCAMWRDWQLEWNYSSSGGSGRNSIRLIGTERTFSRVLYHSIYSLYTFFSHAGVDACLHSHTLWMMLTMWTRNACCALSFSTKNESFLSWVSSIHPESLEIETNFA